MKPRHPALIVASLAFAAALSAGCEDSNARTRAEVQATIDEAIRTLESVSASTSGPEQATAAQQALGGVIRTLGTVREGAPGQQAAAARLAAGAHRQLAAIATADAEALEAEHRRTRGLVRGLVENAIALDAVAAGLESVRIEQYEDELAAAGRHARDVLAEQNDRLAELEQPITSINEDNAADRTDVEALRQEADELYRTARALGPAEGFRAYAEALRLDREADRLEKAIALREIELQYTVQAEHALAQVRARHADREVEALENARESLNEMQQTLNDEARTTRGRLDELFETISGALENISASAGGRLAEAYETAASELDQAATKAQSSARLAASDGAWLAAAGARQDLAQLHLSRARGLDDHIGLLRFLLAEFPDLGAGGDVEAARQARDDAMQKAREAYAQCRETLERVSGRAGRRELETLKARIATLESAASGERIDFGAGSASPAGPAAQPTDQQPTEGGARSPEDLLGLVANADDFEAQLELTASYTHFAPGSPAERRLRDAVMNSTRAMLELERALRSTFGSGLMEITGSMGGAMMSPAGQNFAAIADTDMALGEVSGNRGEIVLGGIDETIPLVRVNGLWYIDGTPNLQTIGASGGVAAAGAPETLMEALGGVCADIARRVRAGEFASQQEFMTAFGQAMMEAQQSAGG